MSVFYRDESGRHRFRFQIDTHTIIDTLACKFHKKNFADEYALFLADIKKEEEAKRIEEEKSNLEEEVLLEENIENV